MKSSIDDKRGAVRLSATAAAVALLCLGTAAQAQQAAQQQPAGDGLTVTVTGIRRGIEAGISVKKNSDSIVESVSAEDIGKLPDNSIAESIARLPGLAAQRVGGRAQTINIRGLSGDFAGTLLNGREQVSTGDNRAIEFDQYPSELLSGVDVYKTPDGTLIGQGLSGTVNMKTVRPLDFGGRRVAVKLMGEKNSMGSLNPDSESKGSRFSASYVDQFADRTLGIALGYARLDSPSQAERWEAWGYTSDAAVPSNVRVLGGFKAFVDSTDQTRDSLLAVVQYKPSKDFESVLDAYYSKFDKQIKKRGFEVGLPWGGATLTNPKVENDFLVAGTFTSIKPVLRNDLETREDEVHAIGWNNKLAVGGGWSVIADLGYSKAEKNETILETYAGSLTRDNATFTFDPSTGLPKLKPGFNYGDPSVIRLVDSGGWGQDGYIKWLDVTDELKSLRLQGSKDMEGLFSKLDFGVNYTEREKTKQVPEAFVDLKGSAARPNFSSAATAVPTGLLVSPVSANFVGFGPVMAYNVQGAYDTLYKLSTNLHPDIFNKNWTVTEKISTFFAKLDIDTELGGIPIRGNVGLQHIRTDQSSTAFSLPGRNANDPKPNSDGKTYSDTLPSLNLAAELPADQKLRLGIAKVVARPRLDWLRASNNYEYDRTLGIVKIEGGNPQAEPFRADAFDLSYEKYFGTKAYFSVAAFHKKLKSYIYEQTLPMDFSGLPNPVTGQLNPPGTLGTMKAPFNGTGGKIEGFEVAVSMPLNLVAPMLDGFGFLGSYSDTRSSIKPQGPGTSLPLPGLSRRVTNLTAYYEKYGFSGRISQVSRSAFVGEIAGFGADRDLVYISPEKVTDLQLGYEFQSGPAKGLSLLFQVSNLTNEPYRRYDGDPNVPKEYVKYGRTYLFGVNYKL
ncbi:TonB-dependent receptor [Aquabacterium humicola]|uniref:TonB-dependent receptor n=1 Tax=Aquabacterium humicola TaxID=3237377 RepID=UPI002543E1C4|nr:TonB-dependent receptor [Rubrivivax pictus]